MKIEVRYPKLPTRILTLVVTFEEKEYFFGISEYDYQAQFYKKHEEQLERIILANRHKEDFAIITNPYIIYIIDGKIM